MGNCDEYHVAFHYHGVVQRLASDGQTAFVVWDEKKGTAVEGWLCEVSELRLLG